MVESREQERSLEQVISEGNQLAVECLQGLIKGTEVSGQLSRLGEIANFLQPNVTDMNLDAITHVAVVKLLGAIELLQSQSDKKF